MSAGETEHAEAELRQRAKLALRNQMRDGARRASRIGLRRAFGRDPQTPLRAPGARTCGDGSRVCVDSQRGANSGRASKRPGPLGSESRCRECWRRAAACTSSIRETGSSRGRFRCRNRRRRAAHRARRDSISHWFPRWRVDPRGYRIGYGGGYYDKLIPRLANACTCAVAYDFQLISEVPELPFDVAVDLVVTDERVIRAE